MKNEKAKFTPGPWEVDGQYIDTPGGLLLDGLQTEHKGERAANMALIAAAPELLAALENARIALTFYRAEMDRDNPGKSKSYPFGIDCENAARAAIAKARNG